MPLTDQRETLAVALFECGEQGATKSSHLAAEFQCFLHHGQTAHWSNGPVESADDATDIDPCRCRLNQHSRINRRIKKGQRADDTFDVHAVANLEEPVLHRIPIAEKLVVLRNTEVQRSPDAEDSLRAAAVI